MAVNFDKEQYTKIKVHSNKPGLLGFVVKIGLAKNRNQAQYILLIITVIAFALTFYLLTQTGEPIVPISTTSPT